jgi:hypothetical protein
VLQLIKLAPQNKIKGKMVRKYILVIGFIGVSVASVLAKDGMWIPTLVSKYNLDEMKQMGFKLSAEAIYSDAHESMKDAVVLFGSGCTGEFISNEGLIITNHHCGFDAIQNHSTLEHDYLTNGFWAKNHQEELPNQDLSVRILMHTEEVTDKVLAGTESQPKDSVSAIISRNAKKIAAQASDKGKYEANVQPFFSGNQYFLQVYQVFQDVRLVGAPPSAIGKFGGDTDNWMWPRHTGDFSIFRVYAGKDNQPAKYSTDNVPYQPKKFFKISIRGIQSYDFALLLGYPGRTQQFLPSQAIRQIMEQGDPDKIKIRDEKLRLLAVDMNRDAKVRIQYASKYQSTSNSWKKWQGEVKGLRRLNAVEAKQKTEAGFAQWVESNPERKARFGQVLPSFEKLYKELEPYTKANDYYGEIIQRGTDLFSLIAYFDQLESRWPGYSSAELPKIQKAVDSRLAEYFNEYNQATDEKIFAALLTIYVKDVDPRFLPEDFKSLMSKTTPELLISKFYRKSIFANQDKLASLSSGLNAQKLKTLRKDPAFRLFRSLKNCYETKVQAPFNAIQKQIDENQQIYVAGIMKMNADKPLWADANKTFRVAYGKVEGYRPMDGVTYDYYTTLTGIMQKNNPSVYDYNVPQALRSLYLNKDYGRYGTHGVMNVCFTASIHTTGGNSGSPVLDSAGNLIGINFDRCWEGTMSDLMYDPDHCRNIILDIRYALFIIDKFAGAGYLLDEMAITE